MFAFDVLSMTMLEELISARISAFQREFGYDIFHMCRGHEELSNALRTTQIGVLYSL